MSKLIIVESPAKARTIKKFLAGEYDVKASMGHVRDLPKSQLGVDVDRGFLPKYVSIKGKGNVIKDLKAAAQKAKTILFATDPDREGEAIAWHLFELLDVDGGDGKRIELHEITKEALLEALENARDLKMEKVNAQQARRILDRLVGYKLSPLLWRKVGGRLSAGRVQSVAVRLICEREREIQVFVPEEYWTITARLKKEEGQAEFEALFQGDRSRKIAIQNESQAQEILARLRGVPFEVAEITRKEKRQNPFPPFTTSTLQQDASRKLGFRVAKTMMVAQQLYEGLDLGDEGAVGLITYMRTDSVRVAASAIEEAKEYIEKRFAGEYLHSRQFAAGKRAQDAHEAIRPTSVFREPESVQDLLNNDQFRLYSLIWARFVASQMAPMVLDLKGVDILAGDYLFRSTGSSVKFPGFSVLYSESKEGEEVQEGKAQLPPLEKGEKVDLLGLLPKQHFTQPPPRYSEASLVKTLEELGIGRPSTYAPIIDTIQLRGYVIAEARKLKPTELGFVVNDLLVKHFPTIMSVEFTSEMEGKLDRVEEGTEDWQGVLGEFYSPFHETLQVAAEAMEKVTLQSQVTDEPCEKCGKPLVIKQGRFGPFLACSGYPECRFTKPYVKEIGVSCPEDGGKIIELRSKKGKTFYGCSNYPKCEFRNWDRPVDTPCPECKGFMVQKRGKGSVYQCINKDCNWKGSLKKSE